MRIQFDNTDQDGNPSTNELTVTVDGERYTITVAGTGTARVPEHVGEFLIESPEYAVSEIEQSEQEPEVEPSAESEPESVDSEDDTEDSDGGLFK